MADMGHRLDSIRAESAPPGEVFMGRVRQRRRVRQAKALAGVGVLVVIGLVVVWPWPGVVEPVRVAVEPPAPTSLAGLNTLIDGIGPLELPEGPSLRDAPSVGVWHRDPAAVVESL